MVLSIFVFAFLHFLAGYIVYFQKRCRSLYERGQGSVSINFLINLLCYRDLWNPSPYQRVVTSLQQKRKRKLHNNLGTLVSPFILTCKYF